MQKILIIGATSAIAEATARRYAMQGARLHLVARDVQRLKSISQDLTVRGAVEVSYDSLDVCELVHHAAVLDVAWDILGEVDVVLIAHGTLPDQTKCEASVEYALEQFAINGTATIALLSALASRLRSGGSIAVISSVAGDRGRASNYLYGSAKAAVNAYASGLRQRLAKKSINVLTIKPGFVDTPMTRDFKKGALWATPDVVARGIVRAVASRRSVAYLPGFWALIMTIIRAIPEPLFKRMSL
jgi:short-subunit dehydrogenase